MLRLKTFPYLHRPLSLLTKSLSLSPPSLSLRSPPLSKPLPSLSLRSPLSAGAGAASTTAMETDGGSGNGSAAAATTVEHVVLFKVRDGTEPSKVDSMISGLRGLTSLDVVAHLAAGPVLRLRSAAASSLGFTHLLHSRYRSKADLAAYSAHPDHVAVVKENVLPICGDIMAVDWLSDGQLPPPSPGSVVRLTLAKPKEGAAAADVLAAIEGLKGSAAMGKAAQLSSGENFSPARAKGYTVGFISVFKTLEELYTLMEDKDATEAHKEKVRPLLDSVIVLDYVVPQPTSASL